jgi:hypothetical protein
MLASMTNYGKPKAEPASNPILKSKEERKKVLQAVQRRRSIIYKQHSQKQHLASE